MSRPVKRILYSSLPVCPAAALRNANKNAMTNQIRRGEIRSVIQEQQQPRRTLKIEAEGDPWQGAVKPKIRLMGRWLEQAGFKPGLRVQVTCVAAGLIELRS